MRLIPVLLMLLPGCSATTSNATSGQEQPGLDLIKNWPATKYSYVSITERGSVELKNEIVEHEGRRVLRFTDSYDVRTVIPKSPTPSIDTKYFTLCQLDRYFTPISVRSEGKHYAFPKGPVDHRLVGGEWLGKYPIKGKVEETRHKVEPPLVLDLAIPRIAATMPFVAGAELKFSFVSTDGYPETDHVLRCVGQEKLEIGKRIFAAWKFEHPLDTPRIDHYWVGEDRRILMIKRWEMLMEIAE